MCEEAICDWWADPDGDEEGEIGEAGEQGAVEQVAGVGDEDLLQDLQAGVAC